MRTRYLPISAAFLFPLLAVGEESATAQATAVAEAPAPAAEQGAPVPAGLFRMPKPATASLEAEVFFSRGEGPSSMFVNKLDTFFDMVFSMMMRGMAGFYTPFSWSLPEDTDAKGTYAGAKAALVFEPCRIGAFSVEAGFLAGKSDFSSNKGVFSGSGTLGGSKMDFHGFLARDYSMDSRAFSLAVFWQPPRIGKWVSFGIEGARSDCDPTYTLYYNVFQTVDGETDSYISAARFDADLEVYDVLLHARTNLAPIPLRGFADGRLSILPEADLAAGYSFRDLDNMWETDFEDGEKGSSWNADGEFPINDAWILRGDVGVSLLYELRGGLLSLGGGYRYEKDLSEGTEETSSFLLRLGYKRSW